MRRDRYLSALLMGACLAHFIGQVPVSHNIYFVIASVLVPPHAE